MIDKTIGNDRIYFRKQRNGETTVKSYSSNEVVAALKMDGWYIVRIKGDHYQFKHDVKKAL